LAPGKEMTGWFTAVPGAQGELQVVNGGKVLIRWKLDGSSAGQQVSFTADNKSGRVLLDVNGDKTNAPVSGSATFRVISSGKPFKVQTYGLQSIAASLPQVRVLTL
jgi:hypothetical protein